MMSARDVLLTGLPRAGTTLACTLLNALPDTVALDEPMRLKRLARLRSHGLICGGFERFFARSRRSILERGCVESRGVDGRVVSNHVSEVRDAAGRRTEVTGRIEIRIDKPLSDDFQLIVKQPSGIAPLLSALEGRIPTYAILRNPISVLASWNSVAMSMYEGHVPAEERLDSDLRRQLARTEDRVERQITLLAWYFERYRSSLPEHRIIRYEDIVSSRGGALGVINPRARELDESLENRNRNEAYDAQQLKEFARRLLETDAAYWHFYSREDVNQVAEG
ncbi:MAG: hypothetical protein VCB42_06395 [Myxococcota bacterium]